ncbi:hypothetical protein SCA6_009137 [Theobroma cacao]
MWHEGPVYPTVNLSPEWREIKDLKLGNFLLLKKEVLRVVCLINKLAEFSFNRLVSTSNLVPSYVPSNSSVPETLCAFEIQLFGEVLNKDLVKLLERSWAYNSGRQSSETFSSRRRHWPSYFR